MGQYEAVLLAAQYIRENKNTPMAQRLRFCRSQDELVQLLKEAYNLTE